VREGAETCDGADWLYASCDDLPQYSGGTLTCDAASCMLDESHCSMPGLDTTAGTMTFDATTGVGPEAATDTDPGAAGAGSGGCDCRVGASGSAWLAPLSIPLLGARRRRRVA
jgi:MYXO-CTERM domain-containing protein